ncbi:MAG: GAF domain-containing protein [Sphingomonas sp.]|nr:GAF domain-containing protein [Sphingomonas sp.]
MLELTIGDRWALLAETLRQMMQAKSIAEAVEIVRPVARSIAQSDGITIVKRIGQETDYLAEDTIEPLWAGLQFPIDKCLAGRAMVEEQTILVPDITQVENIPLNVYLATFIRSLVAVPIGDGRPGYAICAYWKEAAPIEEETLALMEALGRGMGAAFAIIDVLGLAHGQRGGAHAA